MAKSMIILLVLFASVLSLAQDGGVSPGWWWRQGILSANYYLHEAVTEYNTLATTTATIRGNVTKLILLKMLVLKVLMVICDGGDMYRLMILFIQLLGIVMMLIV